MTPSPTTPQGAEPREDGWIEWTGGENPVPGQDVDVQLRNGWEGQWKADAVGWLHDNGEGDIVAYRAGEGRTVARLKKLIEILSEEASEKEGFARQDDLDNAQAIRDIIAYSVVSPTPASAANSEVVARSDAYSFVCKIGRMGHPADDEYSYPDEDDAEREVLNGLIADAREIMAAPLPKQDGLTVINAEEWEPCSPSWLEAHPNQCGKAPRVWDESRHNHCHPVYWPTALHPQPTQQGGAECSVPPHGWSCSRPKGHEGPCAASPTAVADFAFKLSRLNEFHRPGCRYNHWSARVRDEGCDCGLTSAILAALKPSEARG